MPHIDRLGQADVVAALPRLRRYARVLVGDADGADELVRDTLARAWERQRERPSAIGLPLWLFGVMHATHRRRTHTAEIASTPTALDAGTAPENRPRRCATIGDGVCDRLARLPVLEREVLMLVAVERLSYADIAALLGVSTATVISTLAHARARVGPMDAGDGSLR